jgi:hypothetical protein
MAEAAQTYEPPKLIYLGHVSSLLAGTSQGSDVDAAIGCRTGSFDEDC